MTSIIATPNNETGSIALDITKTTDVVKVVRTNVNGSEEVRASEGQLPSTGTGSLILQDYEAAHGLNSYNVYLGPEVRTNRAANPAPGNATGWGTTSAYVQSHEANRLGRPAMIYTKSGASYWLVYGRRAGSPAAGTGSLPTGGAEVMPVTAGQRVYAQMDLGTDTANTDGRFTIRFFNSSFASVGSSESPVVPMQVNTWQTFTHSAVAPAGAVYYWIEWGIAMVSGNTIGGEKTWASRVYASTDPGTYFDGNTPDVTNVTFDWNGTAHASTSTETTSNITVYGSATLTIDKPWLSVPVMPQYSEQVETLTAFGASRESATTVHRPLGRADSLVVMGKLGDRTGSFEVFCNSYAEARKLERIFERGEVVQLRQRVEGMDVYFTVTSIPVAPYSVTGEDSTRWAMVINYVEVRRPIGNLAGALGWTFDELAASATSFDVITQAYATFDALTLGDAIV